MCDKEHFEAFLFFAVLLVLVGPWCYGFVCSIRLSQLIIGKSNAPFSLATNYWRVYVKHREDRDIARVSEHMKKAAFGFFAAALIGIPLLIYSVFKFCERTV